MSPPILLGVLEVLVSTFAGATPPRPAADPSAMREAIRASQESGESFSSSASYAHFLKSRIYQLSGQHRLALNELRLALATDEGNPFLVVAIAEEYAHGGDLDRAEKTLEKLLETSGSYVPAHLMLGRVLAEAGKRDRARVHFKRAVRLEPAKADAWLALAELEVDAGRGDQALAAVESMARAYPGDSKGFRMLGSLFGERGDTARAERALRRAVELDHRDHEAWALLAQAHDRADRYAAAEDAYSRALAEDPENLDLLLAAGRVALKIDALERARVWFERVLALSDDPEVAVRVTFAYLAADRPEDATEVLDRARRRGVQEPRLGYYAGLIYEKLRQFERAAAAYGEVPRSSDLYVDSQIRRGNALSLARAHPRAAETFRKLLGERPDQPEVHRGYARALERSGALREAERVLRRAADRWRLPEMYEALAANLQRQGRAAEAVKLLEEAVAQKPDETSLRLGLAAAYERDGKVDESLSQLRAILEGNPDDPQVLNFIGYLLAENGRDLDGAERMVRRALELKPDTGAYLDSLGWVYFQRGAISQALQLLEQAAALEPDEAVIADHVGDAYRRMDLKAQAARWYRNALEALQRADDPLYARGLRSRVERKLKALSIGSASR
jgi:tetratricopeptide (TPR) repeat protein